MKTAIPRWLLVLLLALPAGEAWALCTLVCSCSVSTTNLNFGSINPLSPSATDSTGSVVVDCGGVAGLLIPYRIDLNAGSAGGTYASRRMKSGAVNAIQYNLYTDNTRTTVWGDGTGGSQPVNGGFLLDVLGLAPAQTNWVYGRVPGSQTTVVPANNYADTISVTLTYY
jgi:spore coat protein U-like protein